MDKGKILILIRIAGQQRTLASFHREKPLLKRGNVQANRSSRIHGPNSSCTIHKYTTQSEHNCPVLLRSARSLDVVAEHQIFGMSIKDQAGRALMHRETGSSLTQHATCSNQGTGIHCSSYHANVVKPGRRDARRFALHGFHGPCPGTDNCYIYVPNEPWSMLLICIEYSTTLYSDCGVHSAKQYRNSVLDQPG